MSGTAHATTQHHIPEDLNSQIQCPQQFTLFRMLD